MGTESTFLRNSTILLLLVLLGGSTHAQDQLLLKSGFEPSVSVTQDMSDISGVDQISGFDWDATPLWIESSRFVYLVNRNKKITDYMASLIEAGIGPYGNKTHVLCMQNKMDDPDHGSTSRNEYSFFMKPMPDGYSEGYVKYWMKLQNNLEELVPKGKASPWYMIMEWKEPNSGIRRSAGECRKIQQGAGGSNNYRININIRREQDAPTFRWHITGQHPQPCRKTEWVYTAPEATVPLGGWFLVEAYMKQHATDGRIYFAVDGRVILDTDITRPRGFTGRTQHATNPLPLKFWSPMKNYHSMDWNRAGPVSQWYDDFELWSGFPPGHPALRDRDPSEEVVLKEHFDYPDGPLPQGWWSEGDVACIRNGRLYVNADTGQFRQSTVWVDRVFSGNLRVEYDACVLASTDAANNMNFFFLYSDSSDKPLFASRQARSDGRYTKYHSLNGYIFTNVANGSGTPARFRLRDCPGFNLLSESHKYENRQRTIYHISVEKRGNHLKYGVNNIVVLDFTDNQFNALHDKGLMGFRTWHTELWWDNFVVTRLK
jgi:hypothetical protein